MSFPNDWIQHWLEELLIDIWKWSGPQFNKLCKDLEDIGMKFLNILLKYYIKSWKKRLLNSVQHCLIVLACIFDQGCNSFEEVVTENRLHRVLTYFQQLLCKSLQSTIAYSASDRKTRVHVICTTGIFYCQCQLMRSGRLRH